MYTVYSGSCLVDLASSIDTAVERVSHHLRPLLEPEPAEIDPPLGRHSLSEVSRKKLWGFVHKLVRRIVLINVLLLSPKSYKEIVAIMILLFQLEEKLAKRDE